MSFVTGFFESAGDALDKRKEYIRAKRDKDRDFLMTYGVQAVTKTQSAVNDVVATGMQLESLGMDKEDINYLVETSGPNALATVYNAVKDIPADRLNTKLFNSIVKRSKDYTPSGTSYEDMVAKAFGLYKKNATDDPAENERVGFWSSMLFDPNAADSALDETYIDGYSGRDIKRIMGTAKPGMKGPLDIDYTAIPKTYSDLTLRGFATTAVDNIDVAALAELKRMAPTAEAAANLKGDAATRYINLTRAIEEEDYRTILKLVPEAKTKILDFDKESRGGLSYNPNFTFQPWAAEIFAEASGQETVEEKELISNGEPITAGNNAAFKAIWDLASEKYPDITPLEEINTYNTRKEAIDSGDPFAIVNGELVKVPTVTAEPPIVPEGSVGMATNDTSLNNTSTKKGRNKIRMTPEARAAVDAHAELLKSFTLLEAEGGSDEDLAKAAAAIQESLDNMPNSGRDAAERLTDAIESLDEFDTPEDATEEGEPWWGYLVRRSDGGRSTPATNDPEDVLAMDELPYTELQPAQTVLDMKDITEITSMKELREKLKSGEIQEGDQVLINRRAYVIEQSGEGPIGEIKVGREFK
jgi:hypothetical protein